MLSEFPALAVRSTLVSVFLPLLLLLSALVELAEVLQSRAGSPPYTEAALPVSSESAERRMSAVL